MGLQLEINYKLFVDGECVGLFAWYTIAFAAFLETCIANEESVEQPLIVLYDAVERVEIYTSEHYKEVYLL